MRAIISLAVFFTGIWANESYWVYFNNKVESQKTDAVRVSAETLQRRKASRIAAAGTEDDLPLNPLYIRLLEVEGARIRTRSRWLNAVSVEVDSMKSQSLNAMPFVRSVEPVAVASAVTTRSDASIMRKAAIDSAYFGPTYHQLALLNIPEVHNLGIFGTGVKIGFLDTGLRKSHPVFNTLKLGAEHDFITGDEIVVWDENRGSYESALSNYAMVMQPEIHGQWMLFIADSTEENLESARVFFASRRAQTGWGTALALTPTYLSFTEGVVRSYAAAGDSNLLLVWESGSGGDVERLLISDLKWNTLSYDGMTGNQATLDYDSRTPYIVTYGDTNLLFYVKTDSVIRMNAALKTGTTFVWGAASDVFASSGIFDTPRASLSGDTLIVAALDLTTGKLHMARSFNMGASFTTLTSPATSRVVAFDIEGNHLICAEIDDASGAFRLHSFETGNAGTTWSSVIHPETYEVIDGVDLVTDNSTLKAVFECAGQVFLTTEVTKGSWDTPSPLSPEEFSYSPHGSSTSGNFETAWVYNGDDNTDYDPTEDGIDVNNFSQPAHGSRTAALAVGYQGGRYMGASPAAELYVAKTEKNINFYGLKYELQVEEDIWIQGLEWLERKGVDIVNSSLAYGEWYSYEQRDGKTSPTSRAASMAADRGVLVLNAAGNVAKNAPYIIPPADAEGILTVGGVDTLGAWWEQAATAVGSAVGPTADGRLKPELVGPAKGVYVINVDDSLSQYYYGAGTSFATPLVAGCAALILQAHPEYRGNPDTLITLLEKSATNAEHPNDTLGYGIPDVYVAIQPLPDTIDTFSRNELLSPYPNPFNPAVSSVIYFPFRLNKASTFTKLRIYTLSGELVLEKDIIPLEPTDFDEIGVGKYVQAADLQAMGAFWDGLNSEGKLAASGLYMVVLHTSTGVYAGKFVLIR